MPYRRLPATDQARLNALQEAIHADSSAEYTERILPYNMTSRINAFLQRYQPIVQQYRQNYQNQISSNKQYKRAMANARMYVSHFIQVLNMSIQRGDMKKDVRELYQLDIDSNYLPDLSTDEDILLWGKNVIEGEEKRTVAGGFPIYNPTIAKVRTMYEIFKNEQVYQSQHRKVASRSTEQIHELRSEADAILLELWNFVEEKYKNLLPYERLCKCQAYGLIYYYRAGEPRLTPSVDKKLQHTESISPTIPFEGE